MGKKRAAAAAMANAYLRIESSPYVELIVLARYFRVVFSSMQNKTRI
jgi:formyltetrahydrofolate hydrolase